MSLFLSFFISVSDPSEFQMALSNRKSTLKTSLPQHIIGISLDLLGYPLISFLIYIAPRLKCDCLSSLSYNVIITSISYFLNNLNIFNNEIIHY